MKQIVAPVIFLLLATSLTAFATDSAPDADAELPPDSAKPMEAVQVYNLYSDKTWLWREGAAYFGPDGQFAAWSKKSGDPSYANGRWWASRTDGKLCFQATWRSAKTSTHALNCFEHRAIGDAIYQRALPAGQWYKFRSSPSVATDECHALKDGDQASEKVDLLRACIAGAKSTAKCNAL